MAQTPEAKVKKRVIAILKKHGVWYFSPIGHGMGRGGIPDIIVCHKGAFLGIECKAGNNQPTKLQERELAGIKKAGGWDLVVNEDLIHEVDDLLGLITDLAERNKKQAATNYAEALDLIEKATSEEDMDDDAADSNSSEG